MAGPVLSTHTKAGNVFSGGRQTKKIIQPYSCSSSAQQQNWETKTGRLFAATSIPGGQFS